MIISLDMNTHGSDRDYTKPLSSKASFSLSCQLMYVFFKPYEYFFNFSKYFELYFHDLQVTCRLVIPYKQGHQVQLEETHAQNQLVLYLA